MVQINEILILFLKATDKTKPVIQTLNGSYVSKAASYLEGLMHDATSSHVEMGSFRSATGSTFQQQQRFSRAFESDSNSVCVSIDDPAVTPRDESVVTPGSTDMSGQSSVVTPQLVSFIIPADAAVAATTITLPVVIPVDHMDQPPPYVASTSHVVNITANEAVVTTDDIATQPAMCSSVQPRCSTSSEESLMGYESPESNQSTVNSMTPLLQFGIGLANSHGDAV